MVITLLTDFGLKDPYAGIMKGVILSINPDVTIVDITHNISSQDVREGSFLVKETYPYFQNGTIHLAIVDPDVGSTRRPILLCKDEHFFIGPDNGIFSHIIEADTEIYEITKKNLLMNCISSTFHGRDIFAPAAAHLASGIPPSTFGPRVFDPVFLADIFPDIVNGVLTGEIIRFDKFGNAATNIDREIFNDFVNMRPFRISTGKLTFNSLNQTYCEKDFTCLINSSGYVEFGFYKGNFERKTGAKKKDLVTIELL